MVKMDKYLAENGKLTFVLKQTLYKSIAGEQFRRFAIEKIKETIPVKCVKVHDMPKLNPLDKDKKHLSLLLKKLKYNLSCIKI